MTMAQICHRCCFVAVMPCSNKPRSGRRRVRLPQAVQNNGSVFVHAVFETRVRPPPLPPAEEGDPGAEAGGEGEERLVQFTRTWREALLHTFLRVCTLLCAGRRRSPAGSIEPNASHLCAFVRRGGSCVSGCMSARGTGLAEIMKGIMGLPEVVGDIRWGKLQMLLRIGGRKSSPWGCFRVVWRNLVQAACVEAPPWARTCAISLPAAPPRSPERVPPEAQGHGRCQPAVRQERRR